MTAGLGAADLWKRVLRFGRERFREAERKSLVR